MEEAENVEVWNKKKIFMTFLVFALLVGGGYLLKTNVLDKNKDFLKAVKGINIEKGNKTKSLNSNTNLRSNSLPIQATIKEKLDELKKEVNNLNVIDIASSSPQVQKIINDLNSLKQYPVNEAKEICQKICGGL